MARLFACGMSVVWVVAASLFAFAESSTTTMSVGAGPTAPPSVETTSAPGAIFPWNSVYDFVVVPLLLLYAFVALAIVCDDYLAPSLDVLSERLNIPHNVAAATFLAFGSSAPEICINCVATYNGKVSMSLGAILGSGLIAYTVIPALCVFCSKGHTLRLEPMPLLRDVFFYCTSVFLFIYFVKNHMLGTLETASLVLLFFLYLLFMVLLEKCFPSPDESQVTPKQMELGRDDADKSGEESSRLLPKKTTGASYGSVFSDGLDGVKSITRATLSIVTTIPHYIFQWTIPAPYEDEEEERPSHLWPWTLIISLAYVTLLSDAVFKLCVVVSDSAGIPHHLSGVTILALGAQIPDAFGSMSVAKQGQGPSAVSNAIGSQIINICIGLALPFLVYSLANHGTAIHIKLGKKSKRGGLVVTGALLAVSVLTLTVLSFRRRYRGPTKVGLKANDAVLLVLIYVVAIVLLIMQQNSAK